MKARPQHEIGFHSFIHENPLKLDPSEERAVYETALTMVPQVIGYRHRMTMLRCLIDYMQGREGVWFATHEDIVRYVLNSRHTGVEWGAV